jgi:biotin carboxyl carrier protein
MNKIGIRIDGRNFEIEMDGVQATQDEMVVEVDGEKVSVIIPKTDSPLNDMEWLIVNGHPIQVLFDPNLRWVQSPNGLHRLDIRDLKAPYSQPRSGNRRINAPIPGLIKQILVQPGESVEMGQPLLVLEAMKMENELRSPRQGIICEVHVKSGQEVSFQQLLAEIV